MTFIFRVVVAVLVARKFLQLGKARRQDPTRYALIGGGIYFFTTLISATIIDIIVGTEVEGLLVLMSIVPTPVGLLAAWIAYKVLESPSGERRPKEKKRNLQRQSISKVNPTSTAPVTRPVNHVSKIHPVKTESDRRDESNRYNKNER